MTDALTQAFQTLQTQTAQEISDAYDKGRADQGAADGSATLQAQLDVANAKLAQIGNTMAQQIHDQLDKLEHDDQAAIDAIKAQFPLAVVADPGPPAPSFPSVDVPPSGSADGSGGPADAQPQGLTGKAKAFVKGK